MRAIWIKHTKRAFIQRNRKRYRMYIHIHSQTQCFALHVVLIKINERNTCSSSGNSLLTSYCFERVFFVVVVLLLSDKTNHSAQNAKKQYVRVLSNKNASFRWTIFRWMLQSDIIKTKSAYPHRSTSWASYWFSLDLLFTRILKWFFSDRKTHTEKSSICSSHKSSAQTKRCEAFEKITRKIMK